MIIQYSKKEMYEAIRKYCRKLCMRSNIGLSACKAFGCPLVSIQPVIVQTDAFNGEYSDRWFSDALEIARSMPDEFWWSELREKITTPPARPQWLGALTRSLKQAGFVCTEETRPSPLPRNNGSAEFKWRKQKCAN